MRQITPYRSRESLWDFMSEVEKAFDEVWRNPTETRGENRRELASFSPVVDLHESKDFYLVSMDLPGVPEKNIKVDVDQGRLSVSGERSREIKNEEGMFRRIERSYGRFERTFALPQNVSQDKIQARYENGVLEVLIPKAEVAQPKSISINKEKGGLFSRLTSGEKGTAAPDTPQTTEKH
ncbi:MAG: Hsp20/alpha crystallin family protein [Bdellovibrionales bacterium]|nr:Hsp20/alpha crystallin family protein [Bdellovibrionales bacterium]